MANLVQPPETTSTQNVEAATPNNQHETDTEKVDVPESMDAPPPQEDYHPATDEDNAMIDAENEGTHSNNVAPEEEEPAVEAGTEKTERYPDGREQSGGRQSTIGNLRDMQDAGTEVDTRTENHDNEEENDEANNEANNEESNEECNEENDD
ncbi:hypothetical protein MY5147_009008 [Beauveria neobassiana]